MVQERINALVSRWRKAFEVGGEYLKKRVIL
jgi:hypothetical protein